MAEKPNEDDLAAYAISDMLPSPLLRDAYQEPRRTFLYCWERDGLNWLIRYKERGGKTPLNAWTMAFIDLNRELIVSGIGRIDWNLRDARLRKEALEKQ